MKRLLLQLSILLSFVSADDAAFIVDTDSLELDTMICVDGEANVLVYDDIDNIELATVFKVINGKDIPLTCEEAGIKEQK